MNKKIFLVSAIGLVFMGAGCSAPAKIQKIIDNATTPEVAPAVVETSTPVSPENVVTTESSQVRWQKPEKIPSLKLFVSVASDQEYEKGGWVYAEIGSQPDSGQEAEVIYYKVGNFIYQALDSEIIMVLGTQLGPGSIVDRYFFVKNQRGITILAAVSPHLQSVTNGIGAEGLVRSQFSVDATTILKDLAFPAELHGALPRQKVVYKDSRDAVNYYSNPPGFLEKAFVDAKYGEVKTNVYNNSFVLTNEGPLVGVYALEPDFFDKDKLVPQITWADGKKNEGGYVYQDVGGCGSSNYAAVFDSKAVDLKKDVVEVGKTNKGDVVYALSDDSHKLLKDMYDSTSNPDGKITYQDFIDQRPLVFWVDPFGRTIGLRNSRFIPQAECGKPVIYLYPKETTKVFVNVKPQGGLTYSDPKLNDGWQVTAETNGDLTEAVTGRYYPYLFWEGRGEIYEQPKQGWVVTRANVKSFLVTKLKQLGLTKSETADFMDFWLPKMQEKPYYFVTFMGNATMDKLAPLTVEPKPDTIIRILMDYTPLDKPIAVKGYAIRTPKRTGFTVVEWGGVMR